MASGQQRAMERPLAGAVVVLDTNIVLDLLVFNDPTARGLAELLESAAVVWLTTHAMRDELERVLAYAQIDARLQSRGKTSADVLAQFDRLSQPVALAPMVQIRCRDRDDQMFIDLAVAHKAVLLSKDDAVLRLHKRLAGLGVSVQKPIPATPAI